MTKKTDEEVLIMAHHACEVLNIDRDMIFGRSHKPDCVRPRHVIWATLLNNGAYKSQVARVFGRNHSTIMTRVDKINVQAKYYPEIKSKFEMLKFAFEIKI